MLQEVSRDEFLKMYKKGARIVLYKEVAADYLTPVSTFQALTEPGDRSVLLESAEKDSERGRLSFLGIQPQLIFQANHKTFSIEENGSLRKGSGDPFVALREILGAKQPVNYTPFSSLAGGAMGFLSYDAIRIFENIPDRHVNDSKIPDLFFQFPRVSIIFDHEKAKVCFAIIVDCGEDPESDYEKAKNEIEKLITKAIQFVPSKSPSIDEKSDPFQVDLEDACYYEKIRRAKQHILDGDAFQIVLSRTFGKKTRLSGMEAYRALRCMTPAPFMFYLETPDFAIAGASPERLVSLKDGMIETVPIAGSRPRGKGEQDLLFEKELLNDEKEIAEHMMLVDLARNDVGRVSEPGSVHVTELKKVRRFSHIMHIASKVEGKLAAGKDAIDLLKAVFPAGTLTGAPKIRAMEIIDHLEESRRGLYGGAFCMIDGKGNLDSCITIRSLFLQKGRVEVRAGAGLVFDSDPKTEADETRHKSRGAIEAILAAEGGKNMILIIDNYDSFTHNLYQLIATFHADIKVARNNEITLEEIEKLNPDAIVLSPGPGNPSQAGICVELIRKFAPHIPILGVCLGHQAIGEAFGGNVIHAPQVMHGKSCSIFHKREGVFKGLSLPFMAGRYHSLVVDDKTLPEVLVVEAKTADGVIMGLKHREYPCFGVQFHPESILTPEGKRIIENFIKQHISHAHCCH